VSDYEHPDTPAELLIEQDRKSDAQRAREEMETQRELSRRVGKRKADEEESKLRRLALEPLSKYGMRKSEWLLDKRIPAIDLTLIIGKGNVGKSTLLTLLCAYITNGVPILDETYQDGDRDVIYCHSEDDVEETILPRMYAANVNVDRVHLVKVETPGGEGMLQIPRDLDALMEEAKRLDAAAIFYDPISSFLRSATGGRNDADAMRSAFLAVQGAHARYRVAGIGLGHTRKAMSDSLLDAFMGSSEQTNVIRSAIGVVADPDIPGRCIISQEKNNRVPWSKSYTYKIETVKGLRDAHGNKIETSRTVIMGTTMETSTDILRGASMPARREAKQFIIKYLNENGALMSQDVVKAAQEKGHAQATVYRAGEELAEYGKIRATPSPGDGRKFMWQLAVNPADYADS
jgi:hypothetical protein